MAKKFEDYKYHTEFESTAHFSISEDYDSFLSLASLKNLQPFLPIEIDLEQNPEVIVWAAAGATVNRVNRNGVGVDTANAIPMAKNFLYKPVDIEHKMAKTVGTILRTGFASFGDNQPLTEEEVKDKNEPFNMALGGVVWRLLDRDFANLIEESADPESLLYNRVSLSWAIGYDEYYVALGERNLMEAEIIKDPKQILEFAEIIKSAPKKTLPKTKDGVNIYRMITGEILSAAYSFVGAPASELRGLITTSQIIEDKDIPKASEISVNDSEASVSTSQKISNSVNKGKKTMKKLTSIAELKDLSMDDLKAGEVSLASIQGVIEGEIERVSKEWQTKNEQEVKAKDEAAEQLKAAQTKVSDLEVSLEKQKTELEATNKKIEEASQREAQREQDARFQKHMTYLDETYDLSEKQKEFAAADVKGLDDEGFKTFLTKFEAFASKKQAKTEGETKPTVASTASEDENKIADLEKALADLKGKKETIANTEVDENQDKYANAFKLGEGVIIEGGKVE